MDSSEFIAKSLELYKEFNQYKLFYNSGDRYDKLISADPMLISSSDFQEISNNGTAIHNWFAQQRSFYTQIDSHKEFEWLKKVLVNDLTEKVFKKQIEISKNIDARTRIVRADLSSFPFGCHEIQSRWAGLGYIHFLPQIFNRLIPARENEILMNEGLINSFKSITGDFIKDFDNEIIVFITPVKYVIESKFFLKDLPGFVLITPSEFTGENFEISKEGLIHISTGKLVKLVFRRELSLKELVGNPFGDKVVELYLSKKINFEPELNLMYDLKVGMFLPYDNRTSEYFTDDVRSLFLETALFDESLTSFNNVFKKVYRNIPDFVDSTTKSKRGYVFKYGGSKLIKSFGGRSVFRFDKNNVARLVEEKYMKDEAWILQKLDKTKFKHRILIGNYDNPQECKPFTSNFTARIKILYTLDSDSYKVIDQSANLVNNHWKSRSKTSDQVNGLGSVTTPVRIDESLP